MFDFDASKLLIVGALALIVLGPKELPRVMRQLGQMIGKVRRMAGEFQGQFMDAMREAELEDIRKEVSKVGDAARVNLPEIDPLADVKKAVEATDAPSAGAYTPPPSQAAPVAEVALDIAPPEAPPLASSESIAAELARAEPPAPVVEAAQEPPRIRSAGA